MNLAEMLEHQRPSSFTKAESMAVEHLLSGDESNLNASFGIGTDSFHWAQMEITPPVNTTQVENPGTKLDKKRRKSKAFRKYEQQLQLNQPRKQVLVHTPVADNSDIIDVSRSSWFV